MLSLPEEEERKTQVAPASAWMPGEAAFLIGTASNQRLLYIF